MQIIIAVLLGAVAVGAGILGTRLLTPDPPTRSTGKAGPQSTTPERPEAERPVRPGPQALFAGNSVWNATLADDAELDPQSDRLMQAFNARIGQEQRQGIGPWIQTDDSSTPVYRVGRSQRTVPVELKTGPWGDKLKAILGRGVPIPDEARPARGPDRHMTVYQPSTDTLWEFWRASNEGGRWTAQWGGVMRNVSKSPGYFTDRSYPGSGHNWGATATSLPVVAGTIMIDELRRGKIDHALALDVPDARKGQFSWPAQRSDGDGGPTTLPEGARLRLDPKVDVDSLGLTRTGRTLALAAQRHGIIVRDVTHHATGFYAEDPTPSGRDPYRGADGLFEGTPKDALRDFPWDRLQLLRMSLCTEAPCERRR